MKVSHRGLAEIASHEGIVLSRYKDSVGVWTIGIGHTKSAGGPDPSQITRTLSIGEVFKIFRQDIDRFEQRVNNAVKAPLKQHEFDALVSFDYNTGGIYKARLTRLLNQGDREGAAKAFLGWLKPPEIKGRRVAEMKLFRTGRYGNGFATVYTADSRGRVLWSKGRRIHVMSEWLRQKEPPNHQPDDPGVEAPPTTKRSLWGVIIAFLKGFFFKR